jgi:peptidoglycan-associated lipoprotein
MYRQGLACCLAATLIFSAGCAMKKKAQEEKVVTTPPPQTQPVAPAVEAPSPMAVVAPVITDEAVAEKPAVVVEEVAPAPAAPQPVEPTPVTLSAAGLQSVPFEYDQHLLTAAAQDILAANAAILKAQGRLRVNLAGYCDERGADQYNIALGERRAEAVRNYLLSLGISEARLETVSYGEEQPLDPGHSESAWVKNRRVEFVPMS